MLSICGLPWSCGLNIHNWLKHRLLLYHHWSLYIAYYWSFQHCTWLCQGPPWSILPYQCHWLGQSANKGVLRREDARVWMRALGSSVSRNANPPFLPLLPQHPPRNPPLVHPPNPFSWKISTLWQVDMLHILLFIPKTASQMHVALQIFSTGTWY